MFLDVIDIRAHDPSPSSCFIFIILFYRRINVDEAQFTDITRCSVPPRPFKLNSAYEAPLQVSGFGALNRDDVSAQTDLGLLELVTQRKRTL